MQINSSDIIIIGAGLTGLTLAYFLRETNLKIQLLEARQRLGGRIHTTATPSSGASIEMGATWLGRKHASLSSLLKTMKLDVFEQALGITAIYEPISSSPAQLVQLPENSDPSFRIRGGTSTLIEALADSIPDTRILLNQSVRSVMEDGDALVVKSETETFRGKIVVSTLPPYLLNETVSFSPSLPKELHELMGQTHTWMGESIKFGLVFDKPFWREAGSSGTVFSNVGPITEMYDHSDYEDSNYSLKGFLNGSFYTLSEEERRQRVLSQLRRYYGDVVDSCLAYHEKVWTKEKFTYSPYDRPVYPHQNNGNALYQKVWMNGKLLIAGSETAKEFPGYMEGAVQSAEWARNHLTHL